MLLEYFCDPFNIYLKKMFMDFSSFMRTNIRNIIFHAMNKDLGFSLSKRQGFEVF